ncbi:MAG: uroporphyrinogen-III C-methyltransferase [Burkholderiales bacterium]|nr:uroporphyrinogen-III C-methyltransferase [Burkholderiales bacterium]
MSEPDKVVAAESEVSASPPIEAPPPRTAGPRPRNRSAWLGVVALVVAVGCAAWFWPRIDRLEREATRRLQGNEQRATQLETALTQAQDELRDARNRIAVLESKVLEAAGLQSQLERLYRSLADDSTDVMLAEVESALTLAAQQLALGSSTQGALSAMQEIETRLGRQNDPSLAPVRRALLRDIDRLKSSPAADLGSMALRIDSILASVDQMPLLASMRPANAPGATARGERAERGEGGASGAASAGLSALRDELQQLFRVRRIDTPDALLVAPEQSYFARENMRLLLLNARLSLMARNDALFRSDVERAIGWLRTYYDGEQRAVANAQAQLRQLLGARLALEPPSLTDSLGAVRAARAAREGAR